MRPGAQVPQDDFDAVALITLRDDHYCNRGCQPELCNEMETSQQVADPSPRLSALASAHAVLFTSHCRLFQQRAAGHGQYGRLLSHRAGTCEELKGDAGQRCQKSRAPDGACRDIGTEGNIVCILDIDGYC